MLNLSVKQFSLIICGLLVIGYFSGSHGIQAQAPSRVPARAIHISKYTFGVADLDRTYAFYHALGVDPENAAVPGKPDSIAEPLRKLVGVAERTKFREIVFRSLGRTVEMTEYSGMDLHPATPRPQDPGASLIELYVGDVEESAARAVKAGAKIITVGGSPISGFGTPNSTIVVTDPDGHYVQLTQGLRDYNPKSKPVLANYTFVVEDCRKGGGFYEKYFNFATWVMDRNDGILFNRLLGLQGAQVCSASPNIPATNQYWGLLEFKGVDRKPHTFRIPDPGSSAIGLEVGDIDVAIAAFQAGGGASLTEGGSVKVGTGRVGLVRDPGGVLIELEQP